MEKLLNRKEIAEILQVKPGTIYQWTHQGYIPFLKVGRFVRFRESDINEWLEKRGCKGRVKRKVEVY